MSIHEFKLKITMHQVQTEKTSSNAMNLLI